MARTGKKNRKYKVFDGRKTYLKREMETLRIPRDTCGQIPSENAEAYTSKELEGRWAT